MDHLGTIVVADLTSWEAMVHLGAALRRHGVRVVRVTGVQSGKAQRARIALERLVFDETRECLHTDAEGRPDVRPILPMLPAVLDVQTVDAIGAELTRMPEWAAQPRLRRVHAAALDDHVAYDKWLYGQVAERAGVTIPRTFEIDDAPRGRPLVVKGRIGSGGDRVRIVGSASGIADVLSQWGLPKQRAMAQELVAGDLWNVGGVAYQGEVLVAAAYRAIASPHDPEGPPVDIVIESRPDQLEATAAFISAMGYTGPFAIDFLQADRPYLLDFNPRFFGTWAAMQSAGVDLLGAYLHTIGRPGGPRRATRIDDALVPASVTGQDSTGDALARAAVLSRRLAPIIGLRGSAVVALEGLAQVRPRSVRRRPAVAVAYVEPWLAALQWGAALRKRGLEVVRHTVPPVSSAQRVRQSVESLCFDRTLHTLGGTDSANAHITDASLLLEGVMDIQMTEVVLRALAGNPPWSERIDLHHVTRADHEVLLFDKQALLDWAQGEAVPVPHHWPRNVMPDRWPVICKPTTGYGGVGVLLCDTPDQLAEVNTGEATTVQEFLPGPQVNVGGVARSGEVLVACAYAPVSAGGQPHGPPVALRTVDDAQALDVAGNVIGGLGYTGPFCVDMVTDTEGRLRVVDLNARVFGSWTGLQRVGVDILGAYLHCLDLADMPARNTPTAGQEVAVDLDRHTLLRAGLPPLISGMTPLVGLRGMLGQAAQLAAGRARM